MDEFDPESYNPRNPWNFPVARWIGYGEDLRGRAKIYWKRYIPRHKFPDQRFVFFQDVYGASTQMHLMSLSAGKTFYQQQWWEETPETNVKASREMISSINAGIRETLGFSYMTLLSRSVMDALYQTVKKVNEGLDREVNDFRKRAILEFLELNDMGDFRPLLFLLEAFTNVCRYGKYCPHPEQNLEVNYGGKKYRFDLREEFNADDYGFLDNLEFTAFLLDESMRMMDMVFRLPVVSRLRYIPARHVT